MSDRYADPRQAARVLATLSAEVEHSAELTDPDSWAAVRVAWVAACDEVDALGDRGFGASTRAAIRRLGLLYLGRKPSGPGGRPAAALELPTLVQVADVVAEVALFAMELEYGANPHLAKDFLAYYRELTADVYPESVVDFLIAYTALRRVKACALRPATDGSAEPDLVHIADIVLRHLRRALPTLVCIGGLPGTGKSTLAEAYSDRDGAIYLNTDDIRRGLRGTHEVAELSQVWGRGAYSARATAAVYDELLRRAGVALREGCSLVLDASWSDAGQRRRAHELALEHHAVPVDILCEVDERAAYRRLWRSPSGYSSAGVHIRESMVHAFDPWPAAHRVETDGSVDAALVRVRQVVADTVGEYVADG